jgi:hypothetical protein
VARRGDEGDVDWAGEGDWAGSGQGNSPELENPTVLDQATGSTVAPTTGDEMGGEGGRGGKE